MSGRRRLMMRAKGPTIIPLDITSKGNATGYKWDGSGTDITTWSRRNAVLWDCKAGDVISVDCVCITTLAVFSEITNDGYTPLMKGLDQWNSNRRTYTYTVPRDMTICLTFYVYSNAANKQPINAYISR